MNRMRLPYVFVTFLLLTASLRSEGVAVVAQSEATPVGTPVSEPVIAGDWTFQVLAVERVDSFYAERLGTVFTPDGEFLILSLAITYNGNSTNVVDRLVAASAWFRIRDASGGSFAQDAEAYAAFAVEESYRTDTPFPKLPSSGVADAGVTHFARYIYDVPAGATGLSFSTQPSAPGQFAIPLPDPALTTGPKVWDLQVRKTELWERFDPPMTARAYEPDGVFIVVHVTIEKLIKSPGSALLTWFALRIDGNETVPIAIEESFAMGSPSITEAVGDWEFALVFDVPEGIESATLITNEGAPLKIEIPLTITIPPTPTPTATATATPTVTPLPTSTPSPSPTPEPGSIRVVPAESSGASLAAGVALEVILDTSGSMLQPLGETTRMEVARAALIDLLTTGLPAEVPLAMRVFGTEPDSCETRLLVPFAPLDPEAVVATVQELQAINLVKTPLGASLEQIANDLADAAGTRIVVLITDGEETCGGDPEAAIRALVESGIDVHVNIVGFALDDESLKETFRDWARIGNGRYIDAGDADELREAVSAAVQPPFRVLDAEGNVVAEGIVGGDAVRVPAGTYRVEVLTDPMQRIEEVIVQPGEETVVQHGES